MPRWCQWRPRFPRASTERSDPWRAGRAGVELFALTGLAIAQPVLDVFGRAPDLFIHRSADRFEIVAFAVVVAAVPALVLWSVELLLGLRWPSVRDVAHLVAVALLATLFGLQFLKQQAEVTSSARLVGLAVLVGVVAVLLYRRFALVRLWLAYLGLAPLLFVALFLTTSRTADLLASQELAAADVAPATDPATVVVLQFDEWPLQTLIDADGRIDADLYPNLAALAADGAWFRNATTAATYTSYAVPASLTGQDPDGERAAIASEHPDNLFTLLGGQFDLDVVESVAHLCPANLCDGDLVDRDAAPAPEAPAVVTPSGLGALLRDARQTYQAMIDPDPFAVSPAATFDDALVVVPGESRGVALPPTSLSLQSVDDLVASIEPDEGPTLHYLHLLLPHTPYRFLPDGVQYSQETGGLSAPLPQSPTGRSTEAAAVAFEHHRLLLQASYTDALAGRVLDRLRATGLYEQAVVVVTADHGIGLEPGGAVRAPVGEHLERRNYADLLYVPLIVKAPGLEPGTVSDVDARTTDLLPTVAGAVGLEVPWATDGIDLAGSEVRTGDKESRVVSIAGPAAGGRELALGDVVRFDGEDVLAEVLARNVDRLLRGDNPRHRLYDVDDAGELVGRRVADLVVVDAAGPTAILQFPEAFEDVDPASGVLPTHLVADLQAEGGALTVAVAVAVDGRIAAVAPTWVAGDQPHHLEAMLVPELLGPGRNRIELYTVGGDERRRTLAPVPLRT